MIPSLVKRSGVNRRATQNKAPAVRRNFKSPNHIPQLITSSTVNHTFRYYYAGSGQTNPTTSITVSRAQLLNTLVMNTGNSTTNYRILNSIKVNHISMWSTALSGLTGSNGLGPSTMQLEWLSTYGPSKLISDTTVNPAQSCMIDSRSPPNSLACFWSTSGSNESDIVFRISSTNSTIIDVNVNYVVQDDNNSVAVTSQASGSLGNVYVTYLDGPRSGEVFQPIGLPSLA
jgi:hypothetical protein